MIWVAEQRLESSTEVLFARVEPALKQEFVERARKHGRSLSAEMRVLLRGATMTPICDG
jgi:hypothetical protein